MTESRIYSRQEALPNTGGVLAETDTGGVLTNLDTGGVLVSSAMVTIVMTGIGWYFVQEAGWQTHHLLASIISFFALATLIGVLWMSRQSGHRFGEANQTTLLRSGLVCLIGSTLLVSGQEPDIGWHLTGLIAVALALDGVDGFLARKLNLASDFGARFDMEIDALLLLILSLLVWQTGQAGAWVLLIGLIRYAFVAASWVCKPLAGPLGPSFRRKTVCALQGIALLTCLLPPLDQSRSSVIAFMALSALVLSFTLDIKALLQGSTLTRGLEERTDT